MDEIALEEKELTYLDIFYGVITSPLKTFAYLAKKEKISWSIWTFLLVELFTFILNLNTFQSFSLPEGFPANIPLADLSRSLSLFGGIMSILLSIIVWFCLSGVLALISQFLGGWGDGKKLFVVLAFTTVPMIFSSLINYFFALAGIRGIPAALASIPIFFWMLFLQVQAVRASQGLNAGKATAVVLFPWAALCIIIVFIIIAAVFSIIPLFNHFQQISL